MAFWRNKITEEMVKKASAAYVEACSYPTLTNARFEATSNGDLMVRSTWSQTSPEIGKKRQFARFFSLSTSGGGSQIGTTMPIRSEAVEAVSAFKNETEIVLSKVKNSKGDDVHLLEVWKADNILKTINLTDLDLHGNVYYDAELGGVAINEAATKVAYIAEAKKPKNTAFFPVSKRSSSAKVEDSKETVYGQEYTYSEEWGEQLIGKSQSVIVTVDLATTEVKVIEYLAPDRKHLCPGQLQWISNDVLVGVAADTRPYRMGLIYCSNRPIGLFKLNTSTDVLDMIREPTVVSCSQPRISPDGKTLVWLETDLQALYPGPHQQCFRLMAMNVADSVKRVVIDIKNDYKPGVDDFAGFYLSVRNLDNPFATNDLLVWNVLTDGTSYPALIDLVQNTITVDTANVNVSIIDMSSDGTVVASKSSPVTPISLMQGKLKGDNTGFNLSTLSTGLTANLPNEIVYVKNSHTPESGSSEMHFSSIYVGPMSGEAASVPLIVWPHGGPHSVITTSFINDVYFFVSQGFACLLINYRGSISHGQDSVMSILGNIGDHDVKDCFQAQKECLDRYTHLDPAKVVLFGGSHGGFLVTHLSGQYPDSFKAVVARNPVINVATMSTVSDIGDWTFNESGLGFNFKSPTPDQMKKMFEMSPISHVANVKAAVYLMIGKDDLRVPPSQGREYFHNLKALGTDVDMNWYEDNHPLGKVPNHCNVFINSVLFFKAILGIE